MIDGRPDPFVNGQISVSPHSPAGLWLLMVAVVEEQSRTFRHSSTDRGHLDFHSFPSSFV